jgi:hypothetical protein
MQICGGGMMTKPRRSIVAKKPPVPAWIHDTANQRKWNGRFIEILKRDYVNSDPAIPAILKDDQVSQICATQIRSYVDRDFSTCLYNQTKARGAETRKRLEIAIKGLREAIGLCKEGGKTEFLLPLGILADEFSQVLERSGQAFATKRHGRDRDHVILLKCHSFLQTKLGRRVTYRTLANLVNAGYEADGNPPKEPTGEEQVRKNLTNFKKKNPLWRLYTSR